MARRKVFDLLILGGLFLCLVFCLVFGNPLGGPLDEVRYGRIQDGMTRRQVEDVLGGPPDTAHLAYVRAVDGGAIYEATWSGNVYQIQVQFDDHGIVVGKRMGEAR
jgi:hypothetical protein